jgi:hypothetical protein
MSSHSICDIQVEEEINNHLEQKQKHELRKWAVALLEYKIVASNIKKVLKRNERQLKIL